MNYYITCYTIDELTQICSLFVKLGINFKARPHRTSLDEVTMDWTIELTGGY